MVNFGGEAGVSSDGNVAGQVLTFPAARTTQNLPAQLTSFVGREVQLAEISRLLAKARLLSLVGAGGCGKTRLALEALNALAPADADGAWFVDLAPIADSALIPQTVATVLGIREGWRRPLIETLADDLADREVLLLLDGCEHLVGACAAFAERLLQSCPRLRILATSREPLGVPGEINYRVPSLTLPATELVLTAERLLTSEAGRLFADRAALADAAFSVNDHNAPVIAEICYKLDGIPLAIELAAARVQFLSVEGIAERLTDRFRLLTGGSRTAMPRHQTLRATVDWSYDLLSHPEKLVFQRLGVFSGGFTIDAAEAICRDRSSEAFELLGQLVHKSLVIREERRRDVDRYQQLDTIRHYALDRLVASGEVEQIRRRHAQYFVELAEAAERRLRGPDQASWLARLEDDHDNLRAAMEWCRVTDPQLAARLAVALGWFWYGHGSLREGRDWLETAVACSAPNTHRRAMALRRLGNLQYLQGNYDGGRGNTEEALAIFEALGDLEGQAACSNNLGLYVFASGDLPGAISLTEHSLQLGRAVGDPANMGTALLNLGTYAVLRHEPTAADGLLGESIGIFRRLQDRRSIALVLGFQFFVALDRRDHAHARALGRESIDVLLELGDQWMLAEILYRFASLAAGESRPEDALRLAGAAAAVLEKLGAVASPTTTQLLERWLESARAALSPERTSLAWSEGSQMTLEDAIAEALRQASDVKSAQPPDRSGLTRREFEIATMVAAGMTNRQISQKLFIAERTAEGHVERIRNKLGFRSRSQVAAWAAEMGIKPSTRSV
jgi:non-specific serine/threonine protein kinase